MSAWPRLCTQVNCRIRVGSESHVAQRALAAGRDDLRAEPHDEAHPEAGRAAGSFERGTTDCSRSSVRWCSTRPRASDDVHVHVAVRLERPARRLGAHVDPRQLVRRVAGAVDVLEEQPLVAPVLRRRKPICAHCQSNGRAGAASAAVDNDEQENDGCEARRAPPKAYPRPGSGYDAPPGRGIGHGQHVRYFGCTRDFGRCALLRRKRESVREARQAAKPDSVGACPLPVGAHHLPTLG